MKKVEDGTSHTDITGQTPLWVCLRDVVEIPLYLRAVKPKNSNCWHVESITAAKRKRSLFSGMWVLLDWRPFDVQTFYSQAKAEAHMRHIFAKNPRTEQHITGDVWNAKFAASLKP